MSSEAEALRKRAATLQARFALLGYTVHECATGGFLVGRWDLSRYCGDLDALESFLRQVEKGR